MIHRIIGPAFAGKTTRLYQLARRCVDAKTRCFFFVPEQQTQACEADLFRLCENRAGEYLEVLNFQRLPNRVFREIGGVAVPVTDKTHRALLLAEVLRGVAPQLRFYGAGLQNADFIDELLQFLTELSYAGIEAQNLDALTDGGALTAEPQLAQKLGELALIYAAYNAALEAFAPCAADEQLRAAEALKEYDFFAGSTVFVDGFYDFTHPEYRLLDRIARGAKELYITFLDNRVEDDEIFTRCREAQQKLAGLWEGLETEDVFLDARRPDAPPDLCYLCEHILLAPKRVYPKAPERLTLSDCDTPYDEVRRALREVFTLQARQGVPFSECAIVYRDGALYAPLITKLAADYGIPVDCGQKRLLSETRLALFFSSAAAIAAGDGRPETLLTLLKTGLTPVLGDAVFLWERYIRTWRLSGAALYDAADHTASPGGLANILTEQQGEDLDAALSEINAARRLILAPIAALREDFAAPSFAAKTAALFAFADACGLAKTVSDEINALREGGDFSAAASQEQLFHLCVGALYALGEQGAVCESGRQYAERLRLAFSFASCGVLPSTPAALNAGEIRFARLSKVRHLFVLGLNADIFPQKDLAAPMLSERERGLLARHKLPLRLTGANLTLEEYFYFYLAAACPTQGLHLSYFSRSLSGEISKPSVLVSRVRHLFPALVTEAFSAKDAPPICPAELFSALCRHSGAQDALTEAARALYRRHGELPLPTPALAAAARDRTAPDGAVASTLSQSKLNAFSTCPYQYFLKYRLNLAEPPRADWDASQTGVMVHAVMERVFSVLRKRGERLADLSDEALARLAQDAAEDYAAANLYARGVRRDLRLDALLSHQNRSNIRLLRALRDQAKTDLFVPYAFECNLRDVAPWQLKLDDESAVKLSGMIDRVDLYTAPNGATYVRVVDYKTGAKDFSLQEVYNGKELQLLIYLFAFWEKGLTVNGRHIDVLPAGAVYQKSFAGALSVPGYQPTEKALSKVFSAAYAQNGLYLNEASLAASLGTPPEKSCADLEQLRTLKEALKSYFLRVTERIRAGDCACAPLQSPPFSAEEDAPCGADCGYCPYRPVCRYEGAGERRFRLFTDRDNPYADFAKGGMLDG